MSEPSVEEIVLAYESAKAMGLPQNYIGHEHADALIADWRKRGERIAELEREVADWYSRGVKEGHGY